MKLSVTRGGFKAVLDGLSGIIEKRTTMQVLTCVSLRTAGGLLEIHATDLNIRKIIRIEAEIDEPGEAIIPAARLREVVNAVSVERIWLETVERNRVEVRAGEYLVKIAGHAPGEFPAPSPAPEANEIEVEASDLQAMVKACSHAASRDETKPHLCGVRLLARRDVLLAVATDGHRISIAGKRLSVAAEFGGGVTVPLKGVEEILRLDDAPVSFGYSEREISLLQGGAEVYARLFEGEYPGFAAAIPAEQPAMATVDGPDLLAAVRRVAIFAGKNGVKLDVQRTFILLTAGSGDDEATDSVPCELHGDPLEIRFSPRYLVEALASLPEGDLFLKLTPGQPIVNFNQPPCVIIPSNMAGWDERLCVVAPARL